MKNVICLDPTQVKEASVLLCRAFYHDPLGQYIVPDEARRVHVLPSFYRLVVRYALRYGEVYTTPEVEGVACWLTPGNTTVSTWQLLRVAFSGILNFVGKEKRVGKAHNLKEKLHAQKNPVYTELVL